MWDIEKIKTILPQREPFLFVDEVVEIDPGKRIVAKRYISPDEYFFKGHFPDKPVMPGVLIIEALAQTSILLYATIYPEIASAHPYYYLAKVKSEFILPVFPDDTLILEARNVKIISTGGIIEIEARVGERIAAKMTASFSVKKKNESQNES
ncbi:MAG: 3-hydroxyacyl-[acyl-carrier-protein] dehydratase FabZ [Candidatus Omnitrophica bacterium CG02_land_8_20_14_3_00__42_8]|nr:MAG: 3-hydroxyacyl-[acyl-carrier-protein] dehydratase FabZ [Candidatus Omnitrophica bacterium CG02_land_8_20_14_3_00__42_8]